MPQPCDFVLWRPSAWGSQPNSRQNEPQGEVRTQSEEMMMMTFITQGGEGQRKTNKKRKATKSKGEALKRGLVARSCARSGRKDVGVGSHNRYNASSVPQAALEDPEG